MELEQKVALITGSTIGIGAETAKLFASQGADVIVTGRRPSLGAQVVTEIEAKGGTAPYFLTATIAPRMMARGRGSIVNVSTMAAWRGMPGLSVYSATGRRWSR